MSVEFVAGYVPERVDELVADVICLPVELVDERDDGLPVGDFYFSVAHGPRNIDELVADMVYFSVGFVPEKNDELVAEHG